MVSETGHDTRMHPMPPAFPVRSNIAIRGSTLVEVLIAALLVVIIAMAGLGYYTFGRLAEFRAMQEQTAYNLAEIEIEAWQAAGYGSLSEFPSTDVPWGYNSGVTPPAGDPSRYPKVVTRQGIDYTVDAYQIANASNAAPVQDFRWEESDGGITWLYRRLVIQVSWGEGQMLEIETRISQ